MKTLGAISAGVFVATFIACGGIQLMIVFAFMSWSVKTLLAD